VRIHTFDTTLRDGTQGEAVSYSVEDKLAIARRLDECGIDYIEGGWPGSNPRDKEFFAMAKALRLQQAKLVAFGSTRFARNKVEDDDNVRALLAAETPVISIFGKTWDFHVTKALGITLEENLKLIGETVAWLTRHDREVVYDAEHFFDGYKANPEYALQTLRAAHENGASVLCLCDTNGGTMTDDLSRIVSTVRSTFSGTIGIHAHNDSDVAVANTLAAVAAGATHVQGCLNGYGERCGNANLSSVIANLEIKLGHQTIGPDNLRQLTALCNYLAELANLPLPGNQPYVGRSAFAHKGGIHVSAIMKDSATYEHVSPERTGNRQRVLLSDMSGRGNILYKLDERGLGGVLTPESRARLLEKIKQLEFEGYDLEAAEGSFELMVREFIGQGREFFSVVNFEVSTRSRKEGGTATTASVILRTPDGKELSASALGDGPVNSLDLSLRKCLQHQYPELARLRLTDYKVRVLDSRQGTGARVRVLVGWSDHARSWATVGVSENVIEASWNAIVDAMKLELIRLHEPDAADGSFVLSRTEA
jgi:2-isopropylmalate synthase